MVATNNCATGTIAAFAPSPNNPWNRKKALHFFRRLGYGHQLSSLIAFENVANPANAIQQIIDEAANSTPLAPPYWADWQISDFDDLNQIFEFGYQWQVDWIYRMNENSIREKMNLFWMNHFVTEFNVYEYSPFMYKYYQRIENNAFGNFKEFVRIIGLDQAMLIYLNGDENTKYDPNENYARELLELFTLGVDNNYTQNDIVEISRAISGWYINPYTYQSDFNPQLFDNGQKTIFGQTGNWNYDDVIDLIFDERTNEVADFVCRKIYNHFVGPNIDETIVAALANTFISNNFELLPVYQQLFKSEHFFDEANIGTIIKSPVDTFITYAKELQFDMSIPFNPNDDLNFASVLPFLFEDQGQQLFSPVDVAGWPGNRSWITSDSLTRRWDLIDQLTNFYLFVDAEVLRNFVIELTDNSNDVTQITFALVDYFLINGLQTTEEYETAITIFKDEVPQNYFDLGIWDLNHYRVPIQVAQLIKHLGRQPEYQLY